MITSLDQVNADWLTAVLARSGALAHGRVESYEADSGERVLSTNARLSLRYAP
jgi:hypothetical protein